jgi:SlyX protein
MNEQRLVELETRVAFQEDHIQALNRSLGLQQRLLERLASEVRELRRHLRALDGGQPEDRADEPAPPHY